MDCPDVLAVDEDQARARFRQDETRDLRSVELRRAAGTPLRLITELKFRSPSAGALSTAIGFIIILVFMLGAYGFLFGGISVIGLLLNGLLIIGAMSMTEMGCAGELMEQDSWLADLLMSAARRPIPCASRSCPSMRLCKSASTARTPIRSPPA